MERFALLGNGESCSGRAVRDSSGSQSLVVLWIGSKGLSVFGSLVSGSVRQGSSGLVKRGGSG